MIYVILAILTLWIMILTTYIIIFDGILDIHKKFLLKLNEKSHTHHRNAAEGHIFCKYPDNDFKCKGVMKK